MILDILRGPTDDEIFENYKDLSPTELLMRSCKSGFLKGVQVVLSKGVNVNEIFIPIRRECDNFPRFNICLTEYSEDGKNLTYISYIIGDGNDYLKEASERGYYDIVKLLLENGANPNSKNNIIVKIAEQNKNYNIVELLKEYINKKG